MMLLVGALCGLQGGQGTEEVNDRGLWWVQKQNGINRDTEIEQSEGCCMLVVGTANR